MKGILNLLTDAMAARELIVKVLLLSYSCLNYSGTLQCRLLHMQTLCFKTCSQSEWLGKGGHTTMERMLLWRGSVTDIEASTLIQLADKQGICISGRSFTDCIITTNCTELSKSLFSVASPHNSKFKFPLALKLFTVPLDKEKNIQINMTCTQ